MDCASNAPVLRLAPEGWTDAEKWTAYCAKSIGNYLSTERGTDWDARAYSPRDGSRSLPRILGDVVLRQDGIRAAHWSRHLLACIARLTGARGLIGFTRTTSGSLLLSRRLGAR
jgi:hypothetical protein